MLLILLFVCCSFAFFDPLRNGRVGRQSVLVQNTNFQCRTCLDKAFCCANQTCCGNPSICCEGDLGVEEQCCNDVQHGPVCCIKEITKCCPAQGILPSRCCPRWNVCCEGGRYGCCDPGTMRAMEDNVAFALFSKADIKGGEPMKVLSVDLNNGDKKEILTNFPTYGEMSRSFVWSGSEFLLPQANFVKSPNAVSLWRIATNGTVQETALFQTRNKSDGPQGLVTGFCFASESGMLVLATYSQNKTGYLFYSVEINSGQTFLLSSRNFTSDDFSGWFKRCSSDGKTLFRMGYRDVLNQVDFGVGVTSITSPSADAQFYVVDSPPGIGQPYVSFDVLSDSEPFQFLSLAGNGDTEGDFSLVEWNTDSSKVVAALKDAYTTPDFGPIDTAINEEKNQFGAVVTTRSILGNKYDRWKAVTVDIPSFAVREHDLSPWMIAETDASAGFGFPNLK